MSKEIFRKSLIIGIILLLVGTSCTSVINSKAITDDKSLVLYENTSSSFLVDPFFDSDSKTINIVIQHYENGRLLYEEKKGISAATARELSVRLMKTGGEININMLLESLDIVQENEKSQGKENARILFRGNKLDSMQNGQMPGTFSFTEYSTPVEIMKAGLGPFSLGVTGLVYGSAMLLYRTLLALASLSEIILERFPVLKSLIERIAQIYIAFHEELSIPYLIPMLLIGIPLLFLILAVLVRLFIFRPIFYWLGDTVLGGIKIKTREHEYIGSGHLTAEIFGFTGISVCLGFYSIVRGHAAQISASGDLT